MKINIVMGFFLPMPPDSGGATEKTWSRLAHELTLRGHEVTVVSRRWKQWPDREVCTASATFGCPVSTTVPNSGRTLRWICSGASGCTGTCRRPM